MNGSSASSDFGLRCPKAPWVCPNDRQLALRAKLRSGWSIKTSQFNTYPKPQPLTEAEQQAIISVVQKAEELDLVEQRRVGKLVDRLESLKKLASGNGVTDCILCGDTFGISVFGRASYKCCDCTKAVCRKCIVELSTGPGGTFKDGTIRLCKICSEYRDLIKRSGAWFYKGVPKYILPEKKNHYRSNHDKTSSSTASTSDESRYTSRYLNLHANPTSGSNSSSGSTSKRMGGLWARSLRSQSECENDSSSSDEAATSTQAKAFTADKLFPRRRESDAKTTSVPRTDTKKSSFSWFHNNSTSASVEQLFQMSDSSNNEEKVAEGVKQQSLQKHELGDQSDHAAFMDNTSQSNVGLSSLETNSCGATNPSPSSPQTSKYGAVDISLLYDDTHEALHCTVHSAKNLIPMDSNGLSDPYCVLKLVPSRFQGGHHHTKTVHSSLNPLFNETLTFYGLSQSYLAWQHLQINVMDDDRWARDCLGFAQIPLHRIRPQQTRPFSMDLENGKLISGEDKEWSKGSILLSLCYLKEKSSLVVGLLRVDLPTLDNSRVSDPVIKVRLMPDANLGTNSSINLGPRKYKMSTKWKNANPDFHEEFIFKVSFVDLPRLAFAISVWEKDGGKQSDYVGGLVLSYSSKGERLKHWNDMVSTPNKQYSKWHYLSPTVVPV